MLVETVVESVGRGSPTVFVQLRCESATGLHPVEVMEFWEEVCKDVGYLYVAQMTDSIVHVADRVFGQRRQGS